MKTNCEEVRDLLGDYLDDELHPAQRAAVGEHLLGCPACREEERAFRDLRKAAARLPQSLAPARDLWPDIAARIDTRVVSLAERRRGYRPAALAAAASLLVALTSAVTWRVAEHRGGDRRAPITTTPGTPMPAAFRTGVPTSDLIEAEREYARATNELMAVIDSRRASLAPETLAAVEQNMRAIDQALQSLRAAVKDDPGNDELTQLLAATHRRKVDALRRVVRLSKL